ncbi:hypothetical protein C7212DRAFT_340853 [Tuber magnatum]|uniref:Uncharacterized protein n=1 Tax=Tuber magnatum TaxID=42249 RepID=A0A317T1V9_9PEZI|nr:hypothetical protein C7212DRAFT_340853 [Tuber magnatum]
MAIAESIPILRLPITIQARILRNLDSFETLENVCLASETLWHTHNSYRDYIQCGIALSSIEALDQAIFTARVLSLSEQYQNARYEAIIAHVQRAPPNELPLPPEGHLIETLRLQDEGISEIARVIFDIIPSLQRSEFGAQLTGGQQGASSPITLEQVKSALYRLRVLLGFLLDSALLRSPQCEIPPGFGKFVDTFIASEKSTLRLVFAIFHAAYIDVTDYHLESTRGDIFQEHMSGLHDMLEQFMAGGLRIGRAQWLRQRGLKPDADLVGLWLLLFLNDSDDPEWHSQIVFQELRPVVLVRELALVMWRARERESLAQRELSW